MRFFTKEQCPTRAGSAIRGLPAPNATRMTFDWILAAIAGGALAILLDIVLDRILEKLRRP